MDSKEIQILVEKFIENSASAQEEDALISWYRSANEQELEWLSEYGDERELTRLQMLSEINREIGHVPARRLDWRWIAIAASLLLFVSVGGYFLKNKRFSQANVAIAKDNIIPGGNKAELHLAGGKKIMLTDAKNGILVNQNNTAINKTSAGQIVYNNSKVSAQATALVYDTLTTPRGGIWHITLADGSLVWLNAATSIRYPEKFIGKERAVELINGEAYFEVAHNASKPFRVTVAGQLIEDIGTHFNVNAYKDEPQVKTTLLEGGIRVSGHGKSVILKPGQQAQSGMAIGIKVLDNADMEETIAWKNGDFIFKDEDFKATMRKIARWYNVEVVYDPSAPLDFMPGGWISRSKNISAVLRIMELTRKVHFKIEGRRIIITK